MKFFGAWLSDSSEGVSLFFDSIDETDLSESSQWTEAHQNEDPTCPAGYVVPAQILVEAARRLARARPDLSPEAVPTQLEVTSLESLGQLCMILAPDMAQRLTTRQSAAKGR